MPKRMRVVLLTLRSAEGPRWVDNVRVNPQALAAQGSFGARPGNPVASPLGHAPPRLGKRLFSCWGWVGKGRIHTPARTAYPGRIPQALASEKPRCCVARFAGLPRKLVLFSCRPDLVEPLGFEPSSRLSAFPATRTADHFRRFSPAPGVLPRGEHPHDALVPNNEGLSPPSRLRLVPVLPGWCSGSLRSLGTRLRRRSRSKGSVPCQSLPLDSAGSAAPVFPGRHQNRRSGVIHADLTRVHFRAELGSTVGPSSCCAGRTQPATGCCSWVSREKERHGPFGWVGGKTIRVAELNPRAHRYGT